MEGIGIVGLIVIIVTGLVSFKGITDSSYLDRYSFQIDAILVHKDYKRLFTSAFLHAGWIHLIFNIVAFYCFSPEIERMIGVPKFLVLYFGSLLGGNLLTLFIHRNHGDYRAVGASGAVSGLIFASIAIFPEMRIGLLFLPYAIPGWAFGLLYVLYSVYGIKTQRDHIGHEAHLGGGLIGLITILIIFPRLITVNYVPILLILIPSIIFLYFILTRPEFLLVDNPFKKDPGSFTVEDKYNTKKRSNEKELDHLLDKINERGIQSLTKEEKEKLEKLSGTK